MLSVNDQPGRPPIVLDRRSLFLIPLAVLVTILIATSELGAHRQVGIQGSDRTPVDKISTQTARLVLPYFEVDTVNPSGITTLFAIRNETAETVAVTVKYYRANQPNVPQLTESLSLAPKRVVSANLRSKDVIADNDDIARGYVVFEADTTAIQGDYFRVDSANNFAAGDRLLDADPTSRHNDLCTRYTLRSFNGGGFDGGTSFTFFVDAELPADGTSPVAFYTVYNEAGDTIFGGPLFRDALAFRLQANDLDLLGFEVPNFGAIEFEFNGTVGHVWGQMDGLGRFSVGLNGSCGDAAPV